MPRTLVLKFCILVTLRINKIQSGVWFCAMVKHLPNQSLERERRKDKGEAGGEQERKTMRKGRKGELQTPDPFLRSADLYRHRSLSSASKLSPHFLGASTLVFLFLYCIRFL